MPTGDEWRARAQAWIPAAIGGDVGVTSADAAYVWLRDNDYYVPREYVRDVWREEIRGEQFIDPINRFDDERTIPRTWYKSGYQKIPTSNRYILEIRGHLEGEFEEVTRSIAIDSDEQLTVGELKEIALQYADYYHFSLAGEDFDVAFTSVYHKTGARWY